MRTAIAALAIVFALPALADEPDARALFEAARAKFSSGDYGTAVTLFKQSYELSKAPGLLFNLGQAYRLKGDCRGALESYEGYLAQVPGAANRGAVSERVSEMRACVEREGKTAGPAVMAELQGLDPVPVVGARVRYGWLLSGLGAEAAGVALVVTGVVFALRAQSATTSLNDFFATGGAWSPELASLERARGSSMTTATALLLAGGGVMLVGAVLVVLGLRAPPDEGLAVVPIAGGVLATWSVDLPSRY